MQSASVPPAFDVGAVFAQLQPMITSIMSLMMNIMIFKLVIGLVKDLLGAIG